MNKVPYGIEHIWSRFNLKWVIAGTLSGILAGIAMLVVAGIVTQGGFFAFPKMIGVTLVGPESMRLNGLGVGGFLGVALHLFLSGFFGFVFAHFIDEHSKSTSILFLGLLGGLAVWLFWSMMYMPSLNEPMTWIVSKTMQIKLHLFFGATFGLLLNLLRKVLLK